MSEELWTWQSRRAIPSRASAGQRLLDEVVQKLRENRWVARDVFGVQLAMEEALVNAITHGNQGDPAKQVHVRCQLAPDLVRIEIADEGAGFDPLAVLDPTDPDRIDYPSGRGLVLMRNFMSRVEFNDVGNRVVMEKHRVNSR